jgi:hypothetical protein
MTKEELVAAVKAALAHARSGDADASYRAYQDLYAAPGFGGLRAEDRRQALKLLIMAKRASGAVTDALRGAHDAAVGPLTELVSTHNEPEDYEMLGLCHLLAGNDQAASNIFRAGLQIERERSPGSDLCGRLMTRISSI